MTDAVLARRSFFALSVALGAGLLTGCGRNAGTATPVGSSGAGQSGQAQPVGAEIRGDAQRMAPAPTAATTENLNRFAAELFAAAVPGSDNAVISPYSVLAALGMAELGADSAALEAMTTVLGAGGDELAAQLTGVDEAVAVAVAASEKAAERGETEPAIVTPANSLFLQHDTPFRQEFLDAVAAGYGVGMFTTDFKSDPEASRQQINAWVSEKTHELIPELLAAETVTSDWRLALVNALYLKAQWDEEFNRTGDTYEFTTAGGSAVSTDRLVSSGRHLAYVEGDGWQAVSIPYVGGDLAMTILLPDADGFDTVAGALDGAMLTAACSGTADREINLTIPPFATDFPVDLTDPLKVMGMEPAFDVPLPKISDGPEPIQMSVVIHQARISVDEFGTEAAAATAVGMEAGAAPGEPEKPIEFTVDRPFLYAIHDTTTLVPLFLGRVTDPTA